MGRPKKHSKQQQSVVNSSLIAKRIKDYSKQKLLRKNCVKQELSARSSTKLNAVMQMDPPGGRRRVGRNPVAEEQQQVDSSSSPTDADSSNDAVPSENITNSPECRRSSRKKTIKFDVRDLLNKNRKSHKIQIEARIDSNAPKVGAGQVSKAELDSKQKNFIEKSAIFRRYSISENKLPPRPPPPPGALIHTIQQCVGELEQLPLEGGELNLAAISPIARRLSRTQDILTASMIKPKQVSSLIVTKLESATTSKAAVAASASSTPGSTKRRAVGRCQPPSSTTELQKPQKRGRKPRAKVLSECTTDSSSSSLASSNESHDLYINKEDKSKEELFDAKGSKVNLLDENSTTGIDLKENLDASAVTLPQPTLLSNCRHSSTDDSFATGGEDVFTSRNISSDESTAESICNSPKGRRIDEISLFERSNSTETNSSDDSEKRHRKIRVAVKRVSLTPQKQIEHLYTVNENSIECLTNNEKFATAPISYKSDKSHTSNVSEISSSPAEICNEKSEKSPKTRKGRKTTPTTPEIHVKSVQKSTVPHNEVLINNLGSPRNSAPRLPIKTIAASSPSTSLKDDPGSMVEVEETVLSDTKSLSQKETASPNSMKTRQIQPAEMCRNNANCETETVPQIRSLRSQVIVQAKPTIVTTSKRQIKINTVQVASDTATKEVLQSLTEVSEKKGLHSPLSDDLLQSKKVTNQDINLSNISNSIRSQSHQTDIKQSLRRQKNVPPESRYRDLNKQDKIDAPEVTENQIANDSIIYETNCESEEGETINPSEEKDDSKSEKKSTIDLTDQSSLDTITSERRRESLRPRSSVISIKKQNSKKISKGTSNSIVPDSSSESSEYQEKSPRNRRQIKSPSILDDKSKEETSSLCSESSSHSSSTSSSSTSSSTATNSSSTTSVSSSSSSPSSSPSSSSSSVTSSTEARSTRSARNTKNAIRNKSPVIKYDSDTDLLKEKCSTRTLNELGKLTELRRTSRLEQWSSEHERDTGESENSDSIKDKSKTRLGRSLGKVERNEIKGRQKLPKKHLEPDVRTDEAATKQEEKNDTSKTETALVPRCKSKKRTRRFVPIKYSSSESGTLSDDGNHSSNAKQTFRLTRTRRKTISSASEIEDIPSALSPPDVALEYLPRKSKQNEVKNLEHIENIDGLEIVGTNKGDLEAETMKKELNAVRKSKNVESKVIQETLFKTGVSRKGNRNSLKCTSPSKKEDCDDVSPESKSSQDFPATESKQELQQSQPHCPLPMDSFTAEEQVNVGRPRKVTRLALKSQSKDILNSKEENKDLEVSFECEDRILKTSTNVNESHLECNLNDGKNETEENYSKNTDCSNTPSEVFYSVNISHPDSPKQIKEIEFHSKTSVVFKSDLEIQQENKTHRPEELHHERVPLVCDLPKNDLDKSPNSGKVTRSTPNSLDSPSNPEILSDDDKLQKQDIEESSKEHEKSKTNMSATRKETRQSKKKMETPNLKVKSTEIEDKKIEVETISLLPPKSDEKVTTAGQRKPTRFSSKSPTERKLPLPANDLKITDEFNIKHDDVLHTSTIKRLDVKEIEVVQQEEHQPNDLAVDGFSKDFQLKSDSETTNLKTKLVEEHLNNSDVLKLKETPKRKIKPTRFSPKSPVKLKSDSDEVIVSAEIALQTMPDEKIDQRSVDSIDESKKPQEISNVPLDTVITSKPNITPSLRSQKKLEIQVLESKSQKSLENMHDNQCSSSSLDLLTKLTRAKKGSRVNAKSSENLQVKEELQKTLDDSQSAINVAFEKSDISIDSSAENTKIKETVKFKQDEQISLQTTQDNLTIGDITKNDVQNKRASEKIEENYDSAKSDGLENRKIPTVNSYNAKEALFADFSSTPVDQTDTSTKDSSKFTKELTSASDSMLINQSNFQDIAVKCTDDTSIAGETKSIVKSKGDGLIACEPSSHTIPSLKPDFHSRKGIKKQLQSMMDTLIDAKVTKLKETVPRRKKKTVEQQQEEIMPAQEISTKKTEELNPNPDIDMKIISFESNQSDDSLKSQEETSKINQSQTSRRQLDSSFIESLEKSLLRTISTKKNTKRKEKDKEPIVVSSLKAPKDDSIKLTTKKPSEVSDEIKTSATSSPKLKKKQPKESPKTEKTTPKRKNIVVKGKISDEVTPSDQESSLLEKQSSGIVATSVLPTQSLKTKAETKFYSPEKPLIQDKLIVIDEESGAPAEMAKEKSPDLLPDPLKDIEKFIEDGVNLLKRCYKIDADDDTSLDRDILKSNEMVTSKKCKLDENVAEGKTENSPPDDDNSNSNSESSTMTTNTSTSEVDTPNGIRRSHRIKNNSKSTKCLVGRGLVRERERFSTKDDEKTIYSIDDQKMDLAEVEAKNSQFLKDMEERLSNFRVIRENEYKCERVISKEAKRMLCDCFLTQEEEERGELGCGEDCLNRLLMIECGSDCTVRERCTNRRFNKFLYSPCRVFRTEKKGFGIMADIEILPGEFIMEYVGEVINGDEFEFRINEYSKDKNKHYYFMALRSDAVIDATAKGNISRFINHSCDPNAETQKWTVNGELRIGFFSRKSIMPGEEITFDYQYQRYGKEAQRCYCESSNCRGWIGAEPSSEEEEEYEGVDEEDESEETEEEEQATAVAPEPLVPSPLPPTTVDNVKEQSVVTKEVPVIDLETAPQPELVTSPPQLIEATQTDITSKPTELPPKKKKEKKRLLEEKLKRREPKQFLEDPDIEDEVRFLVKCGLRNQADTLRLSRLIVRAKLLETRINLLQILRQGELPCRRLFLDYHGLRLLHGWMSEVIDTQDTEKGMEIRMALLSALESLPISNKTMLTDSKVYQTVRDWSNNKESHSPSDGSPKQDIGNTSESTSPKLTADTSSELQKLAAKLVHTWDNLPEVFRIPKRERIEQMKEHEREADRQYKVQGKGSSASDRYRNQQRFMSKSGHKGRFNWSKDKERERVNERRKYAQSSNNAKDGSDKLTGPLAGGESHLSKEQRRELFAAKVARDEAEKRQAEERREFDIKCRFFGLDPKRMRPENMPFCVNPSTGQWYSTDKKPISTPPSYAHVQVPVKPKSTNPEDYRLPEMDLPPLWKFAISPKGKIYYYHVKIRIPQWEPPIKILPLAGQNTGDVKNSESDSSTAGINDSSEDDIEVIKGLDPVKLQAYIEKKIEDRRLQRYNRLVEEKSISPRKEEDRIYNQMEVRKYKENKEKIRKRKEEIRRRRDIIGKQQQLAESISLAETSEAGEHPADALPIQDYLLSSEEEDLIKAECNNSPLIDKIVQGDKIVDELDALQRKRSLKRALPIRDKYEHKKRKLDKLKDLSKSTKRNKDGDGSSSSSKYRKVREKFRCDIAGIIVQHLKPYRNESCSTGKILTDEDFNHLARKLTHFVMVKELKYCESIGQTLIVTESVKNKSREFIKKYMAKYGKVYVRPKNDPEFKDIPFL